jgi:2-polyprenyl-3-methyl-5-hydroxy-6-metoxy-1,4-benzoquinol methylase
MTNKKITDPKSRFAFGKNWTNFLSTLNEERIEEAIKSFTQKTGLSDMTGLTFLDIGSGSGLFSLAAYKLGAKVTSFDYDTDSVACTKYLKEKYCTDHDRWTVYQGSVLDQDFLKQFGTVDVLYSWGVLHHTGHMYEAFHNVSSMVKKDGALFIAIYNDQGGATRRWTWIKKQYTNSGSIMRSLLTIYTLFRQWTITFIKDFLKSGNPLKTWCAYKENRGMSAWHDVVDWVGGYPFEVAKPEEVFHFFKEKGFQLDYLKTCAGGLGCNEFIFKKL